MNFLKMNLILTFVLTLFLSSYAQAMSLVSFTDYDFTRLSYDNRIMLSNDINDDDFISIDSIDSNGDGNVDLLEQETFVAQGESTSLYLGNAHNSYDIARSLLFIGIEGNVDSFYVNDVYVEKNVLTPALDPSVFFANSDIQNLLDHVALFEIETPLHDRDPNGSALGENDPFEVVVHSVVSQDELTRMYCGAYGFISSGIMNSFTPDNSAVLFVPAIQAGDKEGEDINNTSEPVPEPAMLFMFGATVAYVLMKERRQV